MTCTSMSSPQLTRRRMSSTVGRLVGAEFTSVSVEALRAMSAACRKAVRSSPISTNAACIPGSTRDTPSLLQIAHEPPPAGALDVQLLDHAALEDSGARLARRHVDQD